MFFTEFAEDNSWIGGSTGGEYVSPPGKFLVQVYIPEGYMNTEHKIEVHAWGRVSDHRSRRHKGTRQQHSDGDQ